MDYNLQTLQAIESPVTLKELRSFIGSLDQIGRYIDSLAQLSAPLWPLLCKKNPYKWTKDQQLAYQKIMAAAKAVCETLHYNPKTKFDFSAMLATAD